jgi:DNA-binding response OmpR family regulator/anti-sigma regulatory factor (Ser/Thr protein kinase)
MASDKRIQLSFHPDPPHLVMDFDEQKIKHIIYNLLSNALKFTRAGGKVTVNTSISGNESDKQFLITIKDSGIGIKKDEIPYIFDRFYQAKNATSSGTGIGLALTKEIVKLMDGEIKVESEEGWGTEFVVSIPVLDKALTPAIENNFRATNELNNIVEAADLPVRPDQFNNEKQSVLIVEDSPGVVTYIKSIIKDQFNVIVAVNGQEGVELALEHIPDIIISDVMMPEMNGFDLTKVLKQDPRTSHIPIIMLTAKSDLNSKIQGLETGADAYLSKPFEKQELQVRLKKLIELRISLQEKYKSKHITLDEKIAEPDQEDEFLIKVKQVILENIATMDLNVSQISAELFISHTQFYRKIKALTGLTPTQFIRKVRLKKSTEMLSKSTDTIAEIAYSTGFSDPNYFSRVFKKEYNKAPGEWRESVES